MAQQVFVTHQYKPTASHHFCFLIYPIFRLELFGKVDYFNNN